MNIDTSYVDREIVTTRLFNTTVQKLYAAWTNPELLAKWWGPDGFTNTFHEFDLKPGGKWNFIMRGPNGTEYPNRCVFIEIIKDKKISLNHVTSPEFQVVTTFDALEHAAKCTFRMIFATAKECEVKKGYVLDKNEQNFDRLARVLQNY